MISREEWEAKRKVICDSSHDAWIKRREAGAEATVPFVEAAINAGRDRCDWAPGDYNRTLTLPYLQKKFPDFKLTMSQYQGDIIIE